MNHTIKVGNRYFFTAQVVDSDVNKSYDMTVIFMQSEGYPEADDGFLEVVDYYYGEPDPVTTHQYATRYLNDMKNGGNHK